MLEQWEKKHLPRYITGPLFLPDRVLAKMEDTSEDPEKSVFLPSGMESGHRCSLLIWCTGSETGTYDTLISRLPEKGISVVLYRATGIVEVSDFPAEPLEREKAAYARLTEFINGLCTEHTWIDSEQLYIGGAGFGGLVAAYAISETTRFRLAVLGPAVFNAATAFGTGSIGPIPRTDESLLAFCEVSAQHSILTRIDAIKTPVLFLYDRADNRIGLEQVEEFYSAMRDRNLETACRMVVSPENGPNISELAEAFLSEITNWTRENHHGN